MGSNVTYAGSDRCVVFDDFIGGAASAVLTAPFAIRDVSAAGGPTTVYANDNDGVLTCTHAANSENEFIGIDFGDSLAISATKNVVFEARLQVDPAGAAWASGRRMVIGLASAHNLDVDATATSCWFLLGNAAADTLFIEADDGTNTFDDLDTGETITQGTMFTYRIEINDINNVTFHLNGQQVGSASMGAMTSATMLQPYIVAEKDTGTTQDAFSIDYVHVSWDRS